MKAAGREVIGVEEPRVPAAAARLYEAARTVRTPPMRQVYAYHTTDPAAARAIMKDGFDLGKSRHFAFGRGVNLGRSTDQALMYADEEGVSCTLVCAAAVGRSHANRSRARRGRLDTVPDHMHPRAGYDSMTGAAGEIVVVPDPRRVLPLVAVVHRPPPE